MVGVMATVATTFKCLCQHVKAPRTVVVSAPDPEAGHCQLTPSPESPGLSQASLAQSLLGVTAPFPWDLVCTRFCCALQESVSLVLWKFCNQIPLAFQVKFPRGSQSLCLIPRLGSLLWALEILQQQGHILVRQAVGWGHVW